MKCRWHRANTNILKIAAAVLCTLGGAGLIEGRFSDDSRSSEQLELASATLSRLPLQCGDWTAAPLTLNPEELKIAEASGAILRKYTNQLTGQTATVLALCGRPGPISVHPPTACYRARGYRITDVQLPVQIAECGRGHSVLAAEFTNPAGFAQDRVGILWTWSTDGEWSAPSNPRIEFAGTPALFKLYVTWDRRNDQRPFIESIPRVFFRAIAGQFRNSLRQGSVRQTGPS